jgi:hypothetical protein
MTDRILGEVAEARSGSHVRFRFMHRETKMTGRYWHEITNESGDKGWFFGREHYRVARRGRRIEVEIGGQWWEAKLSPDAARHLAEDLVRLAPLDVTTEEAPETVSTTRLPESATVEEAQAHQLAAMIELEDANSEESAAVADMQAANARISDARDRKAKARKAGDLAEAELRLAVQASRPPHGTPRVCD